MRLTAQGQLASSDLPFLPEVGFVPSDLRGRSAPRQHKPGNTAGSVRDRNTGTGTPEAPLFPGAALPPFPTAEPPTTARSAGETHRFTQTRVRPGCLCAVQIPPPPPARFERQRGRPGGRRAGWDTGRASR